MKLEWEQVNKWHLASNPAGFTITRSSMVEGWALQAWHGREHLLTTEGDGAIDRCREACQAAANEVARG